jgi:membrane-bound lytic murein transglycosylase D
MAEIPAEMRLWWRYPTVHSGETLASLGRTYRVTPKAIAEANHLDGTVLEADEKLIIPISVGKHPVDTTTYARRITRYKVRKGDTVETVAENFGVSPLMVRRWNGLRGSSLHGRTVLALHLPVSPSGEVASSQGARRAVKITHGVNAKVSTVKSASTADEDAVEQEKVLHHTVKSGETLYSIATAYKTTVAALKRANENVATLRPGMILTVEPAR